MSMDWDQLSYEDQQMLMEMAGGMEPQATQFDFGETAGFAGQPNVSMYETKGGVDPLSRTEEAGRVNLLQDYGALSLDNILSAYAGAGSYDTDAFTPTYEFGEPLNLKGRRRAEAYAGGGGWQGFVSDLIFKEGLNPDEAMAEMLERVNESDEGLSEGDVAKKNALRTSLAPLVRTDLESQLPSRGGAKTTGEQYDTDKIYSFANDVFTGLMDDPEWAHEQDGMYYSKTPEEALQKTDQMKFFDKYGIPYPTASYEDPEYLNQFTEALGGPAEAERPDVYAAFEEEEKELERQRLASRTERMGASRAYNDLTQAFENQDELPVTTRGALHNFGDNPNRGGPATGMGGSYPELWRGEKGISARFIPPGEEAAPPKFQREEAFESSLPIMTTKNRAGDRVLFDFATNNEERSAFDTERLSEGLGLKKRETRKLEPLKKSQLREQKARRNKLGREAYGQEQQRRESKRNDPRLAELGAFARAYILNEQGQTPFRDAMQVRNANARRMLSGG